MRPNKKTSIFPGIINWSRWQDLPLLERVSKTRTSSASVSSRLVIAVTGLAPAYSGFQDRYLDYFDLTTLVQ